MRLRRACYVAHVLRATCLAASLMEPPLPVRTVRSRPPLLSLIGWPQDGKEQSGDESTEPGATPVENRVQLYLKRKHWRMLLQRLEWAPRYKDRLTIDELYGAGILERITKGLLLIRDRTVRQPSADSLLRNRFRVKAALLDHLIARLVPKPGAPLTATVFEKMDRDDKLSMLCLGHCTYAPLSTISRPAAAGGTPLILGKRSSTMMLEDLSREASFLLSLAKVAGDEPLVYPLARARTPLSRGPSFFLN